MNEFSLVCRILGSLFYRKPQDELLTPLLGLIKEGKLQQYWPLEQDALLARLAKNVSDTDEMIADYQQLFGDENMSVSPFANAYNDEISDGELRAFLQQRGMPEVEQMTDHFGSLLLSASWLEDQSEEDESAAQIELFDDYILPWADKFLGKVTAHANSNFYRTLAEITQEALGAMREELMEMEAKGK